TRSVRTLELFVTALHRAGGHSLREWIVTLPKVVGPAQVEELALLLSQLERKLGLPHGWMKIEIMIETPQALIGPSPELQVPKLVAAGNGRCNGSQFGPNDYTAALNVAASEQRLMHPACDFARNLLTLALAGSGIAVADGPESLMPIGPHREPTEKLSAEQRQANRAAVHRAWAQSCRNIQHALSSGIYQGWDLHPAQLPVRYGTVYAFFLRTLDADADRLGAPSERAAQAKLLGPVFEEAATGQALLNPFLRGIQWGAFSVDQAQRLTGLRLEELSGRPLEKIIGARGRI